MVATHVRHAAARSLPRTFTVAVFVATRNVIVCLVRFTGCPVARFTRLPPRGYGSPRALLLHSHDAYLFACRLRSVYRYTVVPLPRAFCAFYHTAYVRLPWLDAVGLVTTHAVHHTRLPHRTHALPVTGFCRTHCLPTVRFAHISRFAYTPFCYYTTRLPDFTTTCRTTCPVTAHVLRFYGWLWFPTHYTFTRIRLLHGWVLLPTHRTRTTHFVRSPGYTPHLAMRSTHHGSARLYAVTRFVAGCYHTTGSAIHALPAGSAPAGCAVTCGYGYMPLRTAFARARITHLPARCGPTCRLVTFCTPLRLLRLQVHRFTVYRLRLVTLLRAVTAFTGSAVLVTPGWLLRLRLFCLFAHTLRYGCAYALRLPLRFVAAVTPLCTPTRFTRCHLPRAVLDCHLRYAVAHVCVRTFYCTVTTCRPHAHAAPVLHAPLPGSTFCACPPAVHHARLPLPRARGYCTRITFVGYLTLHLVTYRLRYPRFTNTTRFCYLPYTAPHTVTTLRLLPPHAVLTLLYTTRGSGY